MEEQEFNKWLNDNFNFRENFIAACKKLFLTDSCGITWDSYEDYVLYGDAFPPIKVPPKDEGV